MILEFCISICSWCKVLVPVLVWYSTCNFFNSSVLNLYYYLCIFVQSKKNIQETKNIIIYSVSKIKNILIESNLTYTFDICSLQATLFTSVFFIRSFHFMHFYGKYDNGICRTISAMFIRIPESLQWSYGCIGSVVSAYSSTTLFGKFQHVVHFSNNSNIVVI